MIIHRHESARHDASQCEAMQAVARTFVSRTSPTSSERASRDMCRSALLCCHCERSSMSPFSKQANAAITTLVRNNTSQSQATHPVSGPERVVRLATTITRSVQASNRQQRSMAGEPRFMTALSGQSTASMDFTPKPPRRESAAIMEPAALGRLLPKPLQRTAVVQRIHLWRLQRHLDRTDLWS